MTQDGAFDLLKPFVWLALAAFVLGFAVVLVIAAPTWRGSPGSALQDFEISSPFLAPADGLQHT